MSITFTPVFVGCLSAMFSGFRSQCMMRCAPRKASACRTWMATRRISETETPPHPLPRITSYTVHASSSNTMHYVREVGHYHVATETEVIEHHHDVALALRVRLQHVLQHPDLARGLGCVGLLGAYHLHRARCAVPVVRAPEHLPERALAHRFVNLVAVSYVVAKHALELGLCALAVVTEIRSDRPNGSATEVVYRAVLDDVFQVS